jgi:protein disulfide-isomerase
VKKLSFIILAVFILFGCANKNEANNKKKNTKKEQEVVWYHNIEKAVEVAKKENKPVLVQFSGSDWCKWCIKLNNEVFHTKEFSDYAKDNLILVNLDFPQYTPQSDEVKNYNRTQLYKYGVRGFPTVLLLDKNGNLVKVTGYQPGGPLAYIKHIKEAYGIK